MIPEELPADIAECPAGVMEGLARFRQGDLVADVPMFWWADPSEALTRLASRYADDGPGVVERVDRLPFGMVTTQTCDIQEEGKEFPSLPWVQICPVYDGAMAVPGGKLLHGRERSLARKGKSQQLLHLAAFPQPGFWVADFRLSMPVEKGWLAKQEPLRPFSTEADRAAVGARLAWLSARPAFDGRFVKSVQQPFIAAVRKLAKADRDLWERVTDQVLELAVATSQNVDIRAVEVVVLHEVSLDEDVHDWLDEQWTDWAPRAEAAGMVLAPLRVCGLDTITAAEYRLWTRLPLAYVSPNAGMWGLDPEEWAD